jgi:Family of unknown function (DUF5984)
MLFNFRLTPLEQVVPWGEPGDQRLHWFGLTYGEYWIQIGAHSLLEYSEVARMASECPRYCDYQIARLYEDVTEMLPHILDPVPTSLVRYISGDSGAAWSKMYTSWYAGQDPAPREDEFWDVVDAATTWIGQRTLDTGYLRPSANIRLWSDAESVHIEWNNAEKTLQGKPAWTALTGSAQLSRQQFIYEVKAFHTALMSQMGERVDQVLAGVLPQQVQIDFPALQHEHAVRSRPLDREFHGPVVPTDWERVRHAVLEIERTAGV